jgi:nitroimidazol reductase NimA-like FMN-containing flavoprotein (pyridoxamine 5'-phosphate oxidase superfamily)
MTTVDIRTTPSDSALAGSEGSLDEVDPEECWQLLASQVIGRVAVIVGHYPLVFPVNFALEGRAVVYRTGVGAKLHAIHRSNVTFQVDQIDPVHRTGWCVMVKGVAQELDVDRNRRTISSAELDGATPWAPGRREHFVRIVADEISGRRIRPGDLAPCRDQRGYL